MVLNNIWNKDILQHNLSFLALFIGMYEQFEDKVIENVDCFLNLGCSANDDTHCKKSEYYRQNILNRKVDENGNKNKLKATMLWFVDVGAITPEDYSLFLATVYKGNIIKNLIMDCQSYTKYRPNETTGGIFVSWRRKEELPTGA